MYFKYGDYTHTANEVDLTTIKKTRYYSKRNRVLYARVQLTLMGHFCVSGQAALRTAMNALEAAYSYDLRDAALYHDDDTKSSHYLNNSTSINGVRVRQLDYPKGGGAEYATGRTYRIVLEADYLGGGLGVDQIYSFTETVRAIGTGGPSWELIPRFQGPPVARLLHSQTPQRIIQSGEAVGVEYWPLLPGPLLPVNDEHTNRRVVERASPFKIGVHQNLLYPLKYRYEFSRINPIAYLAPRADWS